MAKRTEQQEREICRLDEKFHGIAGELADALAFAHSPKVGNKQIEAFGKCVALARELIRADEKLQPLGAAHETWAARS